MKLMDKGDEKYMINNIINVEYLKDGNYCDAQLVIAYEEVSNADGIKKLLSGIAASGDVLVVFSEIGRFRVRGIPESYWNDESDKLVEILLNTKSSVSENSLIISTEEGKIATRKYKGEIIKNLLRNNVMMVTFQGDGVVIYSKEMNL